MNHHFPAMNKKRRRFIVELAPFYGIEALEFDPEPTRHVMALANRTAVHLPSRSLTNTLKGEFTSTVRVLEGMPMPDKAKEPRNQTQNFNRHPNSSAATSGISYAQMLSRAGPSW